jgi:uncharacterized protein
MDTTRYCPRCRVPLHDAHGRLMTVGVCTTCGGTFLDAGELAQLTRKHAEQLKQLEALVEPKAVPIDPAADHEALRCPGCAEPMARYQYAQCSGVWLDRCAKCMGVWVDDGELAAIEAHIEKGHDILSQGASAMSDAMGRPPEALPGLSADRWAGIGAVASCLARRPLAPI